MLLRVHAAFNAYNMLLPVQAILCLMMCMVVLVILSAGGISGCQQQPYA